MRHLVFDIETTAIDRDSPQSLPGAIHCIVAVDVGTEEVQAFGPDRIAAGVNYLASADRLIGHNISGFDIPVIEGLHDVDFGSVELYDTYLASRLIYASNLYERGLKARNAAGRCGKPIRKEGKRSQDCGNCKGCIAREIRLPSKYLKAHSLDAWGHRLEAPKIKYTGGWERFSQEMLDYCVQDVLTNLKLYRFLRSVPAEKTWPVCSDESILIESRCGYIIGIQQRNGVGFDVKAARALEMRLTARRAALTEKLRAAFPDWKRHVRTFIPKRTATFTKGRKTPIRYEKGVPYEVWETVQFNPDSRGHIADRLQTLYGWEPKDRTPTGQPTVDEKTLASLPYPPVANLLEYMIVAKRLAQLVDGHEGWINHVKFGRIHGRVHVTGTRTSRMSHFKPNMNVPKVKSPYGAECRALFRPTRNGWAMVGCDAERLELMMLAHRLARFDGGEFGRQIVNGDPHSEWQKATGIFNRENQKTFTYAMLYGAGYHKLGTIIIEDWWEAFRTGETKKQPPTLRQAANLGKARKSRLLRHVPALDALLEKCAEAFSRGYITALDGRVLGCKTDYGVLNDVLQSDGEIVMKHAMVLAHEKLTARFGPHGRSWAYMLNVHDEVQLEAGPSIAEEVGKIFAECITAAARKLGVRVTVSGAYKVGSNWSETH